MRQQSKRGGRFSIQSMLLLPMLGVNLLIVAIFMVSINFSDIGHRMRKSEVASIQHTTVMRGEQLQHRMNNLTALAANTARSVQMEINTATASRGNVALWLEESPDFAAEILEASASHLIDALKTNTATGVYLMLNRSAATLDDRGFEGDQVAGLYFIDHDLGKVLSNYSDVAMLCGPSRIASDYGVAVGGGWSEEFELGSPEERQFIQQPFAAAEAHPAMAHELTGYWTVCSARKGEEPVACYTVPLLDAKGYPYGVLGVEVAVDHLEQWLYSSELGYSDDAFYALARMENQKVDTDWVATNGTFAFRYFDETADVRQRQLAEYGRGVMEMRFGSETTAIAVAYQIQLYASGNIFEPSWSYVLVSGVDTKALFEEADALVSFLTSANVIALLIGAALSILVSKLLVVPFTRLATNLQEIDRNDEIALERTNVKEIDLLINEIEDLSADLRESANRTIQAIEMTEMPIGFWEADMTKRQVYFSDYLIELFGLEEEISGNQIDLALYEELFERLMQNREDSEENVYLLDFVEYQPFRWLRIRMASGTNKTFGIVIDVTDEILERRRLELERDTDPLTGLLNRSAFFQRSRMQLAGKPGKCGVMLFADLDNLKYVNDTYGHDIGDRYIRGAAGIFGQFSQHGGVVSRISGDEFAIFLYGADERETLGDLITKTFEHMDDVRIDLPDGNLLKIRCSIGFSWYPDDSDNLEQLLRYADFAMYETKRSVKGSIREFNIQSYLKNSYLVERNEDLNQFIEQNLVRYAFQPIINIFSGEIFAYEALMRPTLPAFQSPQQVLQIARAQAKLYQIERMTIFNVYTWLDENLDKVGDRKIFLNSIPNQILSDKDNSEIQARFSHLFPRVIIEVTENEQSDEEFLEDKLKMIRKLGNAVAIDDYGSGYSNEVAVLNSQPDYIKLDMSLVGGLHRDENRQVLVQNIIEYSRPLGIKVIAEGIECSEEAETLIRLGADYLQGFYLCRPSYELSELPPEISEEIRGYARKYRDRRKDNRRNL